MTSHVEDQGAELAPEHAAYLESVDPRALQTLPTATPSREARRTALEAIEAAHAHALLATQARIEEMREPGEDDVDPEELGEDVEDKPRSLIQRALKLSPSGLRSKPRPREFLLRDASGAGVYVRGKVGMLAAAGGTGKSYALTQLCVAVATGTTWFAKGGWASDRPRRVLGLFAEEDDDEFERRIHYCARAAGLVTDEQLQLLADNFTAIPLAGCGVALTTEHYDGAGLPETTFPAAIRELLWDAMRESRPYDLIVLDPLSRFAGSDVETDNSAATRFVQVVESLCAPDCGGASSILSHHTKKRTEGADTDSADFIRGASGLVNGVRWAGMLEQQKRTELGADLLTLRIVKANGVAPQFAPLVLIRDQEHEGALRVATPDEIESNEVVATKLRSRREISKNVGDVILAALCDGRTISRNDLAKKVGGNRAAILRVISSLVEGGDIEAVGAGKNSAVRLAVLAVPEPGTEVEKPFNPSGSTGSHPPEGGEPGTEGTAGAATPVEKLEPEPQSGTEAEPERKEEQ